MIKRIEKAVAKGDITAPPSKSLSHRYIICAALAKGRSVIKNVSYSKDILATMECARKMGATVEQKEDTLTITGGEKKANEIIAFPCNESGSTMRFFMGIALYFSYEGRFYGSETLRNRPFGVYETLCQKLSGTFLREKDYILVHGCLKPDTYRLPGNVSSQFISGLLFVLPLLKGDSRIILESGIESKSYINLTIQAQEMMGVKVYWKNDTELFIPGNQSYSPREVTVEGDYSNAAFLEGFNTIGGSVAVHGLNPESLQGDKVYLEHFQSLQREKATVDLSDCPDLGPVLFSVAAANHGGYFTGTKRLRIKESDRVSAMCMELEKLGIESVIDENRVEIKKGELHPPTESIDGHNDHRIVMAMTLLLSKTGGEMKGAEAVSKSYPDFFERIREIGIG
ncbi:MAG: 3-phosphoshikimate 1-carboxyvinyltransferase [Lachnospiraceae bacterium]|nr:3-phosphoshikimate 1-carboxyvinyltransferase [Lachnospiraceae bacterium]